MPRYYSYNQTISESQTTVNGEHPDYDIGIVQGATWKYTGDMFQHVVFEKLDAAKNYNGDGTSAAENDVVYPEDRVGGTEEQSTNIDGVPRSVILDYTFEVSDGTTTYEIGVVEVDLNSDGDVKDLDEDGYYLIFVGDPPPPDSDLTITNPVVWNGIARPHESLSARAVCFTQGTLIETDGGPVLVENLTVGDSVLTRDRGYQPIRWIGANHKTTTDLRAPRFFTKLWLFRAGPAQ